MRGLTTTRPDCQRTIPSASQDPGWDRHRPEQRGLPAALRVAWRGEPASSDFCVCTPAEAVISTNCIDDFSFNIVVDLSSLGGSSVVVISR